MQRKQGLYTFEIPTNNSGLGLLTGPRELFYADCSNQITFKPWINMDDLHMTMFTNNIYSKQGFQMESGLQSVQVFSWLSKTASQMCEVAFKKLRLKFQRAVTLSGLLLRSCTLLLPHIFLLCILVYFVSDKMTCFVFCIQSTELYYSHCTVRFCHLLAEISYASDVQRNI